MYLFSTKQRVDKVPSKKEKESNQNIAAVGGREAKKNNVHSGSAMTSTNNLLSSTHQIQPPKIDAIDRRQIEAQNEEKSHTTKEELDDIKRTHYKEKKKKEQSNMDPGPSGINTQGWVSKTLIL